MECFEDNFHRQPSWRLWEWATSSRISKSLFAQPAILHYCTAAVGGSCLNHEMLGLLFEEHVGWRLWAWATSSHIDCYGFSLPTLQSSFVNAVLCHAWLAGCCHTTDSHSLVLVMASCHHSMQRAGCERYHGQLSDKASLICSANARGAEGNE